MPMLTDLPVDILIEIYKAVLDNAPLTCPQIEDIDYEEECPCGRQGPCLPADYAALRATCRTLYNAYREGGSFLDMYCEKPYFVGDLQQAKVLTLVEEFRDEYERKEGRDGYVSYIELDKLRHRIETEPLSGPLLRKMVRNQHALREIIYMSNSEEWRCLMIQPNKNSTYREKRPHYCGIKGVHRLNIEYLTEAMLWRWALVQRGNKHIRRFLNWAFKTYFETGFTGDEYWDYLYDLSTALSKHRRREAVIFDFWQISKHEHIVKSKGFVDCYEKKYREWLYKDCWLDFHKEVGGFKDSVCTIPLQDVPRRVRMQLYRMDVYPYSCDCSAGNSTPGSILEQRKEHPDYIDFLIDEQRIT